MRLFISLIIVMLGTYFPKVYGQVDSVQHIEYLSEISLVGQKGGQDILNLPEVVGTKINAGKKNAVIILENLNAAVVNNSMRQILAKVPGIHIWESDGSGIQVGIANRGLSPNRSWEFNIRQNGADISADPFGYPEAYYNPPMQAVQRIQIIKGAGSLQYGPQFGGLINYVMRDGKSETKPIHLQTSQTVGSYGLYNNFIAASGKKNKVHYYVFYDSRKADGFRENSTYKTQTLYGSLGYQITKKLEFTADLTHFDMLSQQPGGLLDVDITSNSKTSARERNWFSTPWLTGNLKLNWEITKNQRLQIQAFGMNATRKSIGFMKPINILDTINSQTGEYANRDLAIDTYKNKGVEFSYINNFNWLNKKHTFTAGIRYFNSLTNRESGAKGTTGKSADFSATSIPINLLEFNTNNVAVYIEQIFRVNKKLILIPGMRYEWIESAAKGHIGFESNGNEKNLNTPIQNRAIALLGIGGEYHLKNQSEFYFNLNQAYRPVLFSDMLVNPGNIEIDPNIKDANGYSSDFGFRGQIIQGIKVDANVYMMQYNNRIGSLTQKYLNGNEYTFRTNVGGSFAYGFEGLVQYTILNTKRFQIPIYASYSYNHATYQDYNTTSKSTNGEIIINNLKGNFIENSPLNILRTGLDIDYFKSNSNKTFASFGIQYSYVDGVYTDAQNTIKSSANAQNGYIPAYSIFDINTKLNISKIVSMKLSVNNATNRAYFTRRAGGYPGPGAMPSDGRTILFTLDIKI